MELKTNEHYLGVAKDLKFTTRAFIDGRFVEAESGKVFKSINPADGTELTQVVSCGTVELEKAVQAARKAFTCGEWSTIAPAQRKEMLKKLAELIIENQEELAVMESLDSGKPICDTLLGDVPETANTFLWHAESIDKAQDRITVTDHDHLALVVREPMGVIAAILPWNFPMLMAAWKLAPILASGNCVVVKPARLTSLTMLRIAELAMEAGIPEGVLNVLPGDGALLGEGLTKHPDVDCVTFTGSTEVGKKLLGFSGESNAKRVYLEMGGKSPFIVMPDAENLDYVAEQAAEAVFWNMGENCTANSRLLVHKSIKDELVEKLLNATKKWSTGHPLDPASKLGALIEERHMQKILKYIEIGIKEGGELIEGGHRLFSESGGYYVAPTIFDHVTSEMTIAQEEIFGPVLAIMTFDDDDEAVRIANDSQYGLQASLFTSNLSTAHRLSRKLRAGTVSVNCYSEGDITTPFGGFKQSGFLGRDKSVWANDQYTELKTIWINKR